MLYSCETLLEYHCTGGAGLKAPKAQDSDVRGHTILYPRPVAALLAALCSMQALARYTSAGSDCVPTCWERSVPVKPLLVQHSGVQWVTCCHVYTVCGGVQTPEGMEQAGEGVLGPARPIHCTRHQGATLTRRRTGCLIYCGRYSCADSPAA